MQKVILHSKCDVRYFCIVSVASLSDVFLCSHPPFFLCFSPFMSYFSCFSTPLFPLYDVFLCFGEW